MAEKSTPQDKEQKTEVAKDKAPQAGKAPDTRTTAPQAPATVDTPKEPEPDPEPEPEVRGYRVTSRSDVRLDGQLYVEGDELLLTDAVARPLLKNGCIEPEDDSQ